MRREGGRAEAAESEARRGGRRPRNTGYCLRNRKEKEKEKGEGDTSHLGPLVAKELVKADDGLILRFRPRLLVYTWIEIVVPPRAEMSRSMRERRCGNDYSEKETEEEEPATSSPQLLTEAWVNSRRHEKAQLRDSPHLGAPPTINQRLHNFLF